MAVTDESRRNVIVVGVKLDSHSRELLTWSLVKASLPGDQVIALHVIDHPAADGTTSSLLSLVNTLHSVISVYEGFCNLKQVDLKLKVCRGKSVRKILVREAESHSSATVVVGVSKTRHRIGSSLSVAKHCATKLHRRFSVFAVDNGKVVFKRESITGEKIQSNGHEDYAVLFHKNTNALNDTGSNKIKCQHRIRKSCSKCRTKIPEEDCVACETGSSFPDNSASQSEDDLSASDVKDHSSAIAPIQMSQASLDPSEIRDSQCLKPGWAALGRLLPKRQRIEKSIKKPSVVLQVPKLPHLHSSVISPEQKKSISNQNDNHHRSTLDGESGEIIPFGFTMANPLHSHNSEFESFSKELTGLNEKYSDTCRIFSFQELLQATSNFLPENMIGRGGSSLVYRGHLPDGKEFAVKIFKPSEHVTQEFVQEIGIVTALNHKNIVSLYGFCFEDDNLLLVYDFMPRGSLEENLHGHKKDGNAFGWQERYHVAVSVAEALDYLHCRCAEPVIHRDVKSSNILLSDGFEPQLSDFGLASRLSTSAHIICTDVAGTFGYLAPEYLMHGKVSDKIDVYAFGVVLLELLSGRKPIHWESPKGHDSLVMWAKPILNSGNVSQLLDPILGSSDLDQEKIERMVLAATLCIRHMPRLRPSISIVLKLLQGDEEAKRWASQEESSSPDHEESDDDGDSFPVDIQSHLNLALLDIEDGSLSISGSDRSISLDDYLRGRWSCSSSFD